jgi:UDP-N-acetylglucosamine acyltransferase
MINGPTTIGKNNHIYQYSSLGEAPQDKKYNGEPTSLEIGDNNTIREFCTFNRGTVQDKKNTKIGDNNWIMAYVHIAHDCKIGNNTIFSSNAQIAGHVHVHDWAIMGGMSGVHQFVRIGQHAMLGGASALVQDIPPFVIAAGDKASPHGINVEGLKRRGFSIETISALRQAYKVLYKDGHSFEEAKVEIQKMVVASTGDPQTAEKLAQFYDFIAASTRGIIR